MAFDLSDLQKEMVHICMYFQGIYSQCLFVLMVFSGMLLRQTRNSETAKLIIFQSCSELTIYCSSQDLS